MKIIPKSLFLITYVMLHILLIPNTLQLQTINLIKDTRTMGAVLKSSSSFYLLRTNLVEVTISSANARETGISLLNSDGLKPNIITIGTEGNMQILMRSGNVFLHKTLTDNTNITYKELRFTLTNYQLLIVDKNKLLDTEYDTGSIILYLIDYKANVLSNYSLSNSKPSTHYAIKLRNEETILLFTQSADTKIDCTIFDTSLSYIAKQTSSNELQLQYMKVYELEDNVFTLCIVLNKVLKCIAGTYTPAPIAITWKSVFTVIGICQEVIWYHILPIESSGQAISLCYDPDKGDLLIQKFNSNRLKGNLIRLDYWSAERVYDILPLSTSEFIVSFFGYFQYFSNQLIYYEHIYYPSCKNYSIEVNKNENVPIYKSDIFSSEFEKVLITIFPIQGNIVGFDSNPIQLESVYSINTIFYRRGLSGIYSFRYEVVSSNSAQYTTPCLVTVKVLCHPKCKTCNTIGDDIRNDCLSCSSGGLIPYNNNIMLGNCKSACNDGYYADDEFYCCLCDSKCLTCKGPATADTDNCLTCPADKYRFQVNDGSYNCISACPQYYYADSNRNCVKCYDSCAECNEVGTPEAHNCLVCLSGYYILSLDYPATKYNCYDGYCPDSFFVLNNECIKCYDTCETCNLNGIESEQNCNTCKENLYFSPKDNDPDVGNCSTECPDQSFVQGKNCVPCHRDCLTCTEKGNDVNSKCLTCLNNKKVLLSKETALSGNCVTDCPDNSFASGDKCIKCFPFCLSCNTGGSFKEHNCLTCIEGLLQLPLATPNMNNCEYICPDGYYTNDDIKCYNCYNTCERCNEGPTAANNNCLKCIDDYIFHPIIPSNCVYDCKGNDLYWLFNSIGEYECTPAPKCPPSNLILEPKYVQCVKSCTTDIECVQCQKETLYEYRKQCVKECPEFYKTDDNHICIRIPIEGLSPPQASANGTVIYDTTNSKEDFVGNLDNMIEQSLDDILNSKKENPVIIAKNEDYEYVFSKAGSDVSKESNGATIDLGECDEKLREAYNISSSEDLYIGQVIFPQEGKNKDVVQYAVYDSKGKQLNMEVCNQVTLKISTPLNIEQSLLIEAKRIMNEYNLDVFNPNSLFYKDACFNYTDLENKDYTLKGRRAKFIEEESFCTKNCHYAGINFATDEAICDCKPTPKKITPTIDESQFLNNILSSLPLSNMQVFLCFNLFSDPNVKRNYGIIIISVLQFCEVSFFVVYFFVQMPLMFGKCTSIHLNPPIKSASNASFKSMGNQSDYQLESDDKSIKNNTNLNKKCSLNENHSICKSNTKIVIHDLIKDKKFDCNNNNEKVIESSINDSCESDELNEMDYKEAAIKDKRHFCRYYWCIIKEKEIILAAFASDDPFNPYMQRIYITLYILSAYFFVTALFYTDAFVAAPNYFNLMFLMDNELEKCFYVSLVIKILSKFIYMMLSLGKQLRKSYKTKESTVKYRREVAHIIKGSKIKTIVLFVLMIVTSLLMLYYVTIFCRLYPNNQVKWIVSTSISILFTMMLSALICIAASSLRYLAFHYKKEWIYKCSGYISELM